MRFFPRGRDKSERINIALITIIRATLLIAIVASVVNQNWLIVFVGVITFLLSFLPFVFEKSFRIDLPIEFELIIVIFIYASIFLGEAHGYYTLFWGWDLILHAGSALALGFVGFIMLYIMDKTSRIKAKPITIAMFSFCFALAIGALWEIFEFAMDQFFGLNMQKSGLLDTMGDLIISAVGALIASAVGFIYLKTGSAGLFSKIIIRFEKDNRHLFKK